jgi:hypothetical protein
MCKRKIIHNVKETCALALPFEFYEMSKQPSEFVLATFFCHIEFVSKGEYVFFFENCLGRTSARQSY